MAPKRASATAGPSAFRNVYCHSGANMARSYEEDALAEDEIDHGAVLRDRPRLGQAGCLRLPGHRLHHRIVQRVEDDERRDEALEVPRVQPARDQADVDGVGELALGGG